MYKLFIAILLFTLPAVSIADPAVWVNVGFLSHHFKRVGYNEKNTGVGVEVDNFTVGIYKNSVRQTSTYLGYKYQPFVAESSIAVIKAGLTFGTVNGYPDLDDKGFVPMIFPTVSVEGQRFGANIVFAPTYRRLDGFVAIQLKVKLVK